ncbi:tetratricopeptide repeat protein [Streptomyces sp. M92]|uniref:tetratricopeptide repeat protein n=1 Tax=Streptomyces sp. M92 TaxID=2944250 RepID=UPI00234B5266|nr:tetratricopeptide repeat protein [Streptomyces sp. M92]
MELDRRAQIRVSKAGTGRRGFGSGYLIAPRLVLTAAHALDGADQAARAPVTVCLPDTGGREFSAIVRWQRWDKKVDAALVEVTDGQDWQVPQSLADLLTRPPQRYGLLIGTRPHPVTATGFPRLQKDSEGGRRLDEQLTGSIAPGTGALAGRYEITSTSPTHEGPAGAGTRWSGMSGAALLADDGYGGDMLCGVVRRDRRADTGGSRLTATTAANLLADPDFRALITEHTGWNPVLEPVEPATLLTPAAVDRTFRSPAALLRADTQAVAFHSRDRELDDLRTWCESGPPAISVRVLTGPGGQGKTRLARHLTDTLSWAGWATGHLRSDLTDDPAIDGTPPDFATLNTALPLLLVLDYAETRPRLLRRLITHLHRSRHRVRLLLLARSDGQWRTGSFQALPDVRDLLEEAPVVGLGPLTPADGHAQDRHDTFRQAAGDLARLLPQVPTLPAHDWTALAGTLHPPADLHNPGYDNALTLQMTALVALLQHGPRPADTPPGTPAERTLLKHEERFWEASATTPAYKIALPVPTLGAAVAVAALCGAATREEALRVITALPGLPDHQHTTAAAWLASLYPGGPDHYWGSLQPDRVAEYHASQTLEEHGDLLPALLTAGTPAQQAQAITVLARAAIAHYNAERTADSEHTLHTIDTALDTTPLDHEAMETASGALPYPSRILTPLALRLVGTLAKANQRLAHSDPAAREPDLAASLNDLGIRLSEAGRLDEALTAEQEAVEIYQRLATSNPAAYHPGLARSLSNLGTLLSKVGRRSEALTATEEAVVIRRRLATSNPAAYQPNLAHSLSNLGVWLLEVGRRSEALTATEEAVVIRRRLATSNPAAYQPDLAHSLSNLGNLLSEVGRRSEALTAEQEAVVIRRRLATSNPAAYQPDLARSLSNLGIRLLEAGRLDEALTAEQEAVEIYQRLATSNPAAYHPDLARSLSNLGTLLSEVERHSEALTAEQEAVEIYQRLATSNPAAYHPDLAASLSNLGIRLAEAGRPGEALTTAEEAVEIYRRLATSNPAAYEPNFAASLNNLGIRLSEAGRLDEALTAEQEAVEIYQRLATSNPAAYEPDLARSLYVMAAISATGGELLGALRATGEAVELYRRHIGTLPTVLPRLHGVLRLQARLLDGLGREQEAEQVRRWLGENPLPV